MFTEGQRRSQLSQSVVALTRCDVLQLLYPTPIIFNNTGVWLDVGFFHACDHNTTGRLVLLMMCPLTVNTGGFFPPKSEK